jgi:hypothetical protein
MATRTTSQAGDWTDTATWGSNPAPTSADDAVVNHAVAVDANSACLTLAINAALTVNTGFTLTAHGAVTQGNGRFTLQAGAHLVADTTAASFAWTLATGNSQTNCVFAADGTSGSHATVSVTGGNYFHFVPDTNFFHSGGYDCTYCDFTSVRNSAGTIGLQIASFGLTASMELYNCTFDDCAEIDSVYDFDPTNGGVWAITDCLWSNTPGGSQCLHIKVAWTGGTVPVVHRCGFDSTVNIAKALGVEWEDCVFDVGISISGAMTGGTFVRNFVRNSDNDNWPSGGLAWVDCYLLSDDATGNPHWLGPTDGLTYDGLVLDYPHDLTFDTGDGLLLVDASTLTIQNCLMLPGPDGWVGGFLANIGTNSSSNRTNKLYHNTVCGKQAWLAYLKDPGYTQNGRCWSEIKSNLVYSPSAVAGEEAAVVMDLSLYTASPATPWDIAVGSGCTHNGVYNGVSYTDPDNGSAVYDGYEHRFPTSGTPGSNDVSADPQFVDYGRNLIEWAVYKGAATGGQTNAQKVSAARALLLTDPTLVYGDLIPWVRGGYAPTNAAYQDAGHDSVTIGAVEFVSGSILPLVACDMHNIGDIAGMRG